MKGSQLYKLQSKDEQDEMEEIINTISSFDDDKRKLVLQMIRSLK